MYRKLRHRPKSTQETTDRSSQCLKWIQSRRARLILINEEQQIQQNQFDSPPDDFELVPDDPPLQPINEPMQQEAMNKEVQLQEDEAMNKEVQLQEDEAMNKEVQQKAVNKTNEKFTHEENKLLLTLFGITLGSVIMWTLR